MNVYIIAGDGGRSGINRRQMVAARDGDLIHACQERDREFHPSFGLTVPQVLEILSMQPEHFECQFCVSTDLHWQYGYERYAEKAVADPAMRAMGFVAMDGPGYPFVVCQDCYMLIEVGDHYNLAERQVRQMCDHTEPGRRACEEQGGFEAVWKEISPAILTLAREALGHRHAVVPFDPDRWRRGEVKPVELELAIPEPVGPAL